MSDEANPERLRARLAQRLQLSPAQRRRIQTVVSPYRVCPLGAHSDHQHGPVLGMAIDLHSTLAFAPGDGASVRLASEAFPNDAEFSLADDAAHSIAALEAADAAWGRYAVAAAAVLGPRASVGFEACIAGSLPGGGLSSSASVLLAYLLAFAASNEIALEERELVSLARRAENEHIGVACGILDPASIVGARKNELLSIDTASGHWRSIPLGESAIATRILVAYTGISRNLTDTGFNDRVGQCHAAARRLSELSGSKPTEILGDFPDDVFESFAAALEPEERGRASHFFSERRRVREGEALWAAGDLEGFGALMFDSCRSSIEQYETGSAELIALQHILEQAPGVLGARFSGAGFGGCSIALVRAEDAEACRRHVERAFHDAFPVLERRARVLCVTSDDGLRLQ